MNRQSHVFGLRALGEWRRSRNRFPFSTLLACATLAGSTALLCANDPIALDWSRFRRWWLYVVVENSVLTVSYSASDSPPLVATHGKEIERAWNFPPLLALEGADIGSDIQRRTMTWGLLINFVETSLPGLSDEALAKLSRERGFVADRRNYVAAMAAACRAEIMEDLRNYRGLRGMWTMSWTPQLEFVLRLPIALLLGGSGGWLAFQFLLRRTRRSFRLRRGQCLRCSYDLAGNTSHVCPECGAPVGQLITAMPDVK